MSAAAINAIRRCYSIIGMDPSRLRFAWSQKLGESLRALYRRRRAMLTQAGAHLCHQYSDWDNLPGAVRDSVIAAHEGQGAQ